MRRSAIFSTLVAFTLISLLSLTRESVAQAQNQQEKFCESIKFLAVGETQVVRFARPAAYIFRVGDAAIISLGDEESDPQQNKKGPTNSPEQQSVIRFVFVTGKAPGQFSFLAVDDKSQEICAATVNVTRGVDIIKKGEIKSLACGPACRSADKDNPNVSDLPPGSILTTPMPGGGSLTQPVGGGRGATSVSQ